MSTDTDPSAVPSVNTRETAMRSWTWNCFLLLLIIVLAVVLRTMHLAEFSLWTDELSSLLMANGRAPGEIYFPLNQISPSGIDFTAPSSTLPLSGIHSALATDTHPQLYFFTLRFWRNLFGAGDAAARSLSVLASGLAIFYLYDTVKILHRSRASAAWAALIMALAAPQIIFAQEARGYAMLSLLLLVAIDAIVRMERLGFSRMRWVVFALSVWLAATTHYLAIPASLALGAYILIRFDHRLRWRIFSAMAVAGVLFLITSGELFWSQRSNFSTNLQWLSDPEPGFTFRMLQRLAVLPVQFFIAPRTADIASPLGWFGATFYLLPLIVFWQRDLLIWVLLAAAIIATAAISDLLQHRASLMHLRFTIAAAPAAYAMVAAIGNHWRKDWMRHLLPAAIALCCMVSLPEAYNQPWKPNYRELAGTFDRLAGPDDLIVIPFKSRAQSWEEAIMLNGMMRYSAHPSRPVLPISEAVSADLSAGINRYPQAWFMNFDSRPAVDQFIPNAQLSESNWVPAAGSFWKLEIPALPPTTSRASEPLPAP